MAADYGGATPAQALEDLLTFALDEDAAVARRILHVKRQVLSRLLSRPCPPNCRRGVPSAVA
jgi:hypothetical protein